jgi:transposase InsO family protein
VRDAVNQGSRKPLTWGGLKGYQQLQAIAEGLAQLEEAHLDAAYLLFLKKRVEFVLAKNRTVAEDLEKAHHLLRQVADCLPDPGHADQGTQSHISCHQVAQEMEHLIQKAQPNGKIQRTQIRLLNGLQKRWEMYGPDLLHCYKIPGLPPDNLKLESFFGRLRRHQRRISGRKSTRELLDFGQAQVLFSATSQQELLSQIQSIPPELYHRHLQRLVQAEAPRQFFRRLHHDPLAMIQALLAQHRTRSLFLQNHKEIPALEDQVFHTE